MGREVWARYAERGVELLVDAVHAETSTMPCVRSDRNSRIRKGNIFWNPRTNGGHPVLCLTANTMFGIR